MRSGYFCLWLVFVASGVLSSCGKNASNAGLKISYGPSGIQQLSFNGIMLEDLARHPASDAFHIWHMKLTSLNGKPLTGRQYDWGEVNEGRKWDPTTHTWLYSFVWGSISVQFVQQANTLDMKVTEENKPDSGVTLDGATIYPLVLHFPELPKGFGDASYEHLALKPGDPVPTADFGDGHVSIVADGKGKPVYHGFEPAGGGPNFFPVISSTAMDSMSTAYPKVDRPVTLGATDSFTVSLRFATSDSESR